MTNPANAPMDQIIANDSFHARRVLVVGLGRFQGGVAVSRWLVDQGARVTVTDQASEDSLQSSLASLADLPIEMQLGSHNTSVLDSIDLAVINPAVNKQRSAFFGEIIKRGIPWTTEINLFCQRCPATVIGVTGTFGKSTTCAMLDHVLRHQDVATTTSFANVHLGGNIGRSLLPQLDTMLSSDVVVLELSSAQLEDIPTIKWQPNLAVITNISEQHIDRHGTYEHYVLAKRHILGSGNIEKGIVLGLLHGEAEARFKQRLHTPNNNVIRPNDNCQPIDLRVPGAHNQSNARIVIATCQLLGISESQVRAALTTFAGLPHRLEHVGTIDGVDYYNDSKSTAPTATLSAVQSLDCPIIAIVGGQRKSQPLADWAAIIASRCRAVICIGESGPDFAQAIKHQCTLLNETQAEYNPDSSGVRADSRHPINCCYVHELDSIEAALSHVRKIARPGHSVLFSPGAPSFDQFNNYEHRGEVFIERFQAMR